MKLYENDWLTINHLLLKMYSQRSRRLFDNNLMQNLKFLIPYDKASFFLHNHEGDTILHDPTGIGFPEGVLEQHMVEQEVPHVWVNFYEKSLVVRDSDICNGPDQLGAPYYSSLLLNDNIKYALTISLAHEKVRVGVLTLFREKGRQDFSDKEVYIAEQIMEHIACYCYKIYDLEKYSEDRRTQSIADIANAYTLSAREAEVLKLLLEGRSTKDICESICVAETTAKKHLSNIYSKMGIKNKAELFKVLSVDILEE